MAISRERKELPENRWCQNDRIFEGFSDFQKQIDFLDFWISVFLYFWVFFVFLAIFWERKELREIRGCQNDRIFGAFQIFKKKLFLDFWISGFLYFCNFLDFWPYLGNEKS